MRSQRTTKIPLKFDDFVHSKNNSTTSKKKNATKNKGKNTGYKSDGCGVNRDVGVSDTMGEIVEEMEAMDDREGDNSNGGMSSEEEGVKGDKTGDLGKNDMEHYNEQSPSEGVSKENDDIKEVNAVKKTFAEVIDENLIDNDRKLECIPTEIDENGVEVVVFNDVMVAEGIKRWDLTLCGFFVGHKMAVNELRYNLRRMWSRFGFKDIVDYNNGVYYMKFHHEEGLNNVVNIQKWSVDLKLDNTELERIPLWVRLCNIPIEAWTVKGISALASRIRKPLIMDYVTASKCKQGVGLVRFARVLIKVNAKKEMSDNVEVVYKSSKGSFQCRNNIKVIYEWKSHVWTDCGVFGHDDRKCPKKVPINLIKDRSEKSETVMQKTSEKVSKESPDMKNDKASGSDKKVHEESTKKWSVHKDILDAMKRSANKYSLFELCDVDEQNELRDLKKMEVVEEFLNKNAIPTENDMMKWDIDMVAYYKQKKELLVDKGELVEEEDVLEEVNGIARNFKIGTWNIRGLSSSDKQKEVMKFIKEENLQVCAILETHLKNKRIVSVCDRIYGRWNWITNMRYCNKGCKIMIGWNEDVVSIFVIHMARQSTLVKLETISNVKFYGAFIYAANGGIEMRELWKDLEIYRRIVRTDPWYLSGDMNVTLAPNEHSVGGSNVSSDMKEFQCCVNNIEVEDINSSGLFYTWTKNLHKVKQGGQTGILKKLDRIMGSEDFMSRFSQAYALFLPYIISDHCPTVLILPKCVQAKKKPFKFANFTTEKEESIPLVNQLWEEREEGCKMEAVKEVQHKIDKDPHNHDLRSEEAGTFKAYTEAMKEEELILYQKVKVKWLSVRDRNNAYFHKAIKSRQQRNRIDAICDENGSRVEGGEVAEKFVNHFQIFLGESKKVGKISNMESLFQNKLSEEDDMAMIREVIDDEIKQAMFKIDDNKI
ncbi:RNA-directed DNA polymerase, eukaryota, reverse transcriptase zinc-binding domain protein [Tanacetum coccineum]